MKKKAFHLAGISIGKRQGLPVLLQDQAWELLPSFQLKHITSGRISMVESWERAEPGTNFDRLSPARVTGLCASATSPGPVTLEVCSLV